jgi:hypothetical protein
MNLIDKIKVVVLDCYGTVVGYGLTEGQKQTARKGLIEFLDRMVDRNIDLVIATDDHRKDRVFNLLNEIGIAKYFAPQPLTSGLQEKRHNGGKVSDQERITYQQKFDHYYLDHFQFYGYDELDFTKHEYGDKDFARIAEDFEVGTDEIYFIGDNGVGRDKRSAERYNVEWTNCEQYHPNAKFGDEYDFNSILQPFVWDDEKVKDFTKFCSSGIKSHGLAKTIADKLEWFKIENQKGDSK